MIPFKRTLLAEPPSAEAAPVLQWFRNINIKQLIVGSLLWCVLSVLLALGALNVNAISQYPPISLRYDTPFSGQAAYQARVYSIEHSDEKPFWPTFWHETQLQVESEYGSIKTVCIFFSGDAALVWPAQYLGGTAPGVTDGIGCSVSSSLAWKLWGGSDIIGKTVEIDGVTRTVRGVFDGEDELVLVSVRDEATSQSFTAVELSGGPSDPTRSDAVSFARSAGLGAPDSVLMDTPASLAQMLAALPLFILAFYGLALCIARLKARPAALRLCLLLALLGVALFLPRLLDMLPGWMIPTRWSDFSFWGSFMDQIGDNLREYLVLRPRLRDVAYKVLLLKQAAIAFLATGCALSICFRWHGKRQRV